MIQIENLKSKIGNLQIDNLHLKEHTVIAGPSGSGKTTLLKCIKGSYQYEGKILTDGEVSAVWHESQLLPNLTINENLKIGGYNISYIQEMCSLFKVTHTLYKYPHECSCGEQQRINIIKSISTPSKVILLDEPMQGIDPILVRKTLKTLLNELTSQKRIVIMVTHELYQIYGMFNKAIFLKGGELVAYDDLRSLYDYPLSPWMANFFGTYTILDKGDLKNFDLHSNEDSCLVRPEWFKIKVPPFKRLTKFNATVTGIQWHGSHNRVSLVLDNTKKPLSAEVYADIVLHKGQRVYVNFKKCARPDWVRSR